MPKLINTVNTKRIVINNRGPISLLGGIYGPTVPMVRLTEEIARYLQAGLSVSEVEADGTVVAKLDLTNYDKDLQGEEIEVEAPVTPKAVDTTGEIIEKETPKEDEQKQPEVPVKEEVSVTNNNNQNKNKNNNFSKADTLEKK